MNSSTLKSTVISFLALTWSLLPAQHESIRKSSNNSNMPITYTDQSMKLIDRFGNRYRAQELALNHSPALPLFQAPNALHSTYQCSAGIFRIHFVDEPVPHYGFDTPMHRNVICEVFSDLSRLLHCATSTPIVDIYVGSDTSISASNSPFYLAPGSQIAGTSFEPMKYGLKNAWMDNMIYTTIKTGISAYQNLNGLNNPPFTQMVHGVLIVNFKNKTWYTNYRDTSAIPTSTDDLYTHTLHQALHMLGLSSNILANGQAISGNNLYARYDNFLYKNTTASKLVTYNPTTKKINQTNSFALGCSTPSSTVFSGTSLTNALIYNDTPFQKEFNLSHFGCSGTGLCNSTYAKPSNPFVLVPCLGAGWSYVKRRPSQSEVFALCDMGYKLRSIGGVYAYGMDITNSDTAGAVYQTYSACTETCVAVGAHDTIMMDSTRSVTKPLTMILSNDAPTTAIIARMELLDTAKGTLTISGSNFTFTPHPSFRYGHVTMVYFPQCSSTDVIGNATYITIIYPYPPLPPCVPDNNCNYICNGSFEESDDPMTWSNFNVRTPYPFDFVQNTPELFHSENGITCLKTLGGGNTGWILCNNTPIITCYFYTQGLYPPIGGGNQFYGLFAAVDKNFKPYAYSEGFYFKLKKPIYHDTTKHFLLSFMARKRNSTCANLGIVVAGDDTIPKPMPFALQNKVGTGLVCSQFCDSIGAALIGADTWKQYTIPIRLPKAGDSFTSIVIYSDISGLEPPDAYAYFDNFELFDSSSAKIAITSSPYNTMPCEDTTQTVAFQVCLSNMTGTNPDSILLNVNLPYGFSVVSGSDFNSAGKHTIPIGSISTAVCDTLYLRYQIDYSKVNYNKGYDISIGYSTSTLCNNAIADVVRIYPQNNAVVVNKTVSHTSPQIGDTITYNIEVCNQSKMQINDLELIDTLPVGLDLEYSVGFDVQDRILRKTINIDSANASGWTCLSYFYTVVVRSNCQIVNKVSIASPSNPCFKSTSAAIINASSTGSPVVASISPHRAVWCGNSIPLTAQISNPTGTYTYQWQKNSVDISGATNASYTATSNGVYGLKILKNGCTTQIASVSFDSSFSVSIDSTRPNCTASNGTISISPSNGVKPFTYAWSGSGATTATRTGLTAGVYIVTITDSIGCAVIDTVSISAIPSTMTATYTVTNAICSDSNGLITYTPSNGKSPYLYLWSRGDGTQHLYNASAGIYRVTVTDSFGCQRKDTISVSSISNIITPHDSILDITCNRTSGSIYLRPTSTELSSYSYLWENGSTSSIRTGLSKGIYRVTISDSFGCRRWDTFMIDSLNSQLVVTDSIIHPICSSFNGEIYLKTTGGTTPYNYTWSTGTKGDSLWGYASGTFTVTVMDANYCAMIKTYTLTATSYAISSIDSVRSIYCGQGMGSIDVYPQGGTSPYTYIWENWTMTPNRTNLGKGTYTVTIMDYYGCDTVKSFIIDSIQTTITILDSIKQPTNCASNDGAIYLRMTSGTAPYTYLWSNGSTAQTLSNVHAGLYAVTVTDANGCSATKTMTIPVASTVQGYISSQINCTNNTAFLKFINTNGAAISSYFWKNLTLNTYVSSADTVFPTQPGHQYRLTITEPNGCQTTFYETPSLSSHLTLGSAYGTKKASVDSAIYYGYLSPKDSFKKITISGTLTVNRSWSIRYSDIALGEGAKILIQSSNCVTNSPVVEFIGNTIYTCGDKLAKGIEVACSNTSFTAIRNQFSDCYKAIEISQSAQAIIHDNLFLNDLIGIHVIGSLGNPVSITNADKWRGNSFQKRMTLGTINKVVKKNYTGMTPDSRSHSAFQIPSRTGMTCPWAAMIIEHCPSLSIGVENDNTGIVKIYNMNCGILHYGGTLQVRNTIVNGLHEDINANFISRVCVMSVEHPTMSSNLNMKGLGKYGSFMGYPAMVFADFGVYLYGSVQATITDYYMSMVRYGISTNHWLSATKPISLTIKDNNIGAENIALLINNYNTANFKCFITNNQIRVGGTSSYNGGGSSYAATGIQLTNVPTTLYNSYVTIQDNNLATDSLSKFNISLYGFPKTTSAQSILVKNNTIAINKPHLADGGGIEYVNSYNIDEQGNNVSGTNRLATSGNRIYPVGFDYQSSEGVFTCNTINNLRTGVRFFGTCTNTNWMKNKLNNHFYGLRIENGSTLRDQIKAGNSFSGTCDTEAISWQPVPTKFYYANTNTIYFPNPSYPITSLWWKFLTGPASQFENNICTSSNANVISNMVYVYLGTKGNILGVTSLGKFIPMSRNNELMTEVELTEVDTAILTNSMTIGLFEPELTWQLRQELYSKLKPYEADYPDSSIYLDYLSDIELGTISEFTEIRRIERKIVEENVGLAQTLDSLQFELDSSWRKISRLDSLYYSTDSSLRTVITADRQLVYQRIYALDSLIYALYSTTESVYVDNITAIQAINDSILPEGLADSLQIAFNDVYYASFGTGKVELTPSQYATYRSLAEHCPLANQEVVYRSRGVVRTHYDTVRYQDSILCAQVGITLKALRPSPAGKKTENPLLFSVYPIPTRDIVHIRTNIILDDKLRYIVTDLLGHTVYDAEVEPQANIYGIDTKAWTSGVYLLRILRKNEIIHHSQITVIR